MLSFIVSKYLQYQLSFSSFFGEIATKDQGKIIKYMFKGVFQGDKKQRLLLVEENILLNVKNIISKCEEQRALSNSNCFV